MSDRRYEVHPSGVVSRLLEWFGPNQSKQTQMPVPLGGDETRQPPIAMPAPFGRAMYRITRRHDRGSAAFAYDGGRLWYNPIGGGIVAARRLEPLPAQGGVARVVNHTAIFFTAQMTNGGAQPTLGPLYDPATLSALVGPLASPAVVSGSTMAPGFGGG